MHRLRHPIRAIREPFGTAGLIIAVVALIAALGGSAIAAKGALTGKQRKEVEKIAKKYAGKPGAAGATGPAGPAGKDGGNGANGTNGSNGANGTSVTTAAASAGECPSGGIKVLSASAPAKVCNGTTGFTEFLPSGKTETGTFATPKIEITEAEVEAGVESVQLTTSPISFAIPLEAPLGAAEVHFVSTEEQEGGTGPAQCPGSAETPLAERGNLCLYQGGTLIQEENAEGENEARVVKIFPATGTTGSAAGAATAGADALALIRAGEGQAFMQGTWAVTAP
ncbi:MAG TPA: hypothetical protein VMF55_08070 [Solirubrobacterales bacterium]|nr:hypothetical protein [Solirubrobacterales bacterium]